MFPLRILSAPADAESAVLELPHQVQNDGLALVQRKEVIGGVDELKNAIKTIGCYSILQLKRQTNLADI